MNKLIHVIINFNKCVLMESLNCLLNDTKDQMHKLSSHPNPILFSSPTQGLWVSLSARVTSTPALGVGTTVVVSTGSLGQFYRFCPDRVIPVGVSSRAWSVLCLDQHWPCYLTILRCQDFSLYHWTYLTENAKHIQQWTHQNIRE